MLVLLKLPSCIASDDREGSGNVVDRLLDSVAITVGAKYESVEVWSNAVVDIARPGSVGKRALASSSSGKVEELIGWNGSWKSGKAECGSGSRVGMDAGSQYIGADEVDVSG